MAGRSEDAGQSGSSGAEPASEGRAEGGAKGGLTLR